MNDHQALAMAVQACTKVAQEFAEYDEDPIKDLVTRLAEAVPAGTKESIALQAMRSAVLFLEMSPEFEEEALRLIERKP